MLGNISPWQLLIIFLIVLLIFGTKKLRNMGGDLGSAIRDFRKGMSSEEEQEEQDAKEKGRDTYEKPTSAKASEVDAKKSNNQPKS